MNRLNICRPILPASKQANVNLLKKAMKAAQSSIEDIDEGEYNPEIPGTAELPNSSDPETKKKQREILLEEHKKLQRLKSQQEENEETTVIYPSGENDVNSMLK